MIKKKIRDMSETQLDGACVHNCEKCRFSIATRDSHLPYCALMIKDRNNTLSDKFLDQEVEIDILTKEERDYLEAVICMLPFKTGTIQYFSNGNDPYLVFEASNGDYASLPLKQGLFKGMQDGKIYDIEELGL